jgi:hypothetical protein
MSETGRFGGYLLCQFCKIGYVVFAIVTGVFIFLPLYIAGAIIGWSDHCKFQKNTCDIWNIIAYISMFMLILKLCLSCLICLTMER